MSVDAVVYYRVSNATVSVANVEDAHSSTRYVKTHIVAEHEAFVCRLLAQTTLRNILGTKDLHEILSDRDSISGSMQASTVTASSQDPCRQVQSLHHLRISVDKYSHI